MFLLVIQQYIKPGVIHFFEVKTSKIFISNTFVINITVMRTSTKTSIAYLIVLLLSLLGSSSCSVKVLTCDSFKSQQTFLGNKDVYIKLINGEKIKGTELTWKTLTVLGKRSTIHIKLDGHEFNVKEIYEVYDQGNYYRKCKGSLVRRIISGKINIYYYGETSTSSTTNRSGSHTTFQDTRICYYYIQAGEDGDIRYIAQPKDILPYVKDCPQAVEIIKRKVNESFKNYAKDLYNYSIQNGINTYNNDCN